MSGHEIRWSPGPHTVVLSYADGPARLLRVEIDDRAVICPSSPLPLIELGVVGSGRSWSARRYIDSVAGQRLTYRDHAIEQTAEGERLVVTSDDQSTGLEVTTTLSSVRGTGTVTFESRIVNAGTEDVDLSWVTSATWGGALAGSPIESLRLWWAENDWLAENRWFSAGARELLPDLTRSVHEHDPRGAFSALPSAPGPPTAACLWACWWTRRPAPRSAGRSSTTGRGTGRPANVRTASTSACSARPRQSTIGMPDCAPGDEFTTVPATVALSTGGYEGVVAELTAVRRARAGTTRITPACPSCSTTT